MSPAPNDVIEALLNDAPDLLRWSGAVARKLRSFNIALEGKSSGNANTDALTLADLTVQELVVAGLRDRSPILRECRIEAEEENGDLGAFREDGELTIALDPIDGTKQFRDRTGNGYSVMLHLRTRDDVLFSLVYCPEDGPTGSWTMAYGDTLKCGPDDLSVSAQKCLEAMPNIQSSNRPDSRKIYLIGFQKNDAANAEKVTAAGLEGFPPDETPGSIYPLLATGEFGGSLIHSPNIYDYPVSMQIARLLGGDSVWVHNGEPVHFEETWMDDRASMLRLPGIVATADSPEKLKILVDLARDWNPVRYVD
ncbi:inositol monophosphatase family protein [Thalassoglobus sp. JC818]|uniref:inositol monophosphatase family protein n=1 Tax=Thalassoglobus sp. JC818 TaxID=3232136 RepID=UPI003457682C